MTLLEQFAGLFAGSTVAYGDWVQEREPKALTRHGKPTIKQYEDHLEGRVGLGIVPVNAEGRSVFGAIDIDIDTINHAELQKEVARRGMPLNVCRSKSGGAHLYILIRPPGIQAIELRQILTRWATALGHPSVEIFPKQTKSDDSNIGNWINLPYFGGDSTTRYCVGSDGSLTLEQFLTSVKYYVLGTTVNEIIDTGGLPPCLAALQEQGLGEGSRNMALFNFAVFYRKSDPESWQAKTRAQNAQFAKPPLEHGELEGIVGSISQKKYQYTCEQEPIRSYCNREKCLKMPFGVAHMPWEEKGTFSDVLITSLRKINTQPPTYTVAVNGKDIRLSRDDLHNFRKFSLQVFGETDVVMKPRKQDSWLTTVQELLQTVVVDNTPPDDANIIGLMIEKLREFLGHRERATDREDVLKGLPFQEGDVVMFRALDFKRYLQNAKLDLPIHEIYAAIRHRGGGTFRPRINGEQVKLWTYPISALEEQTEDFKVPNFNQDHFEEV